MPTFKRVRAGLCLRSWIAIAAASLVAACQSGGTGTAVSSFSGFDNSRPAQRAVLSTPAQPVDRASVAPSQTTLTTRPQPKRTVTAPKRKPIQVAYAPQEDGPSLVELLRPAPGKVEGLPGVKNRSQVSSKRKKRSKTTVTTKPKKSRAARRRGGSFAARRKRYRSLIAKHARANGVPLRLAMAVVEVESTYRANARGAAGEIGLMQIMPRTARFIGYKGKMKSLYNPDTNLRYGMKYLGKAHRLAKGKTCGTILKYNAGHGAKRMNPISRRYCKRVSRILRRG